MNISCFLFVNIASYRIKSIRQNKVINQCVILNLNHLFQQGFKRKLCLCRKGKGSVAGSEVQLYPVPNMASASVPTLHYSDY